jgi:hypothetical protein
MKGLVLNHTQVADELFDKKSIAKSYQYHRILLSVSYISNSLVIAWKRDISLKIIIINNQKTVSNHISKYNRSLLVITTSNIFLR